MSKAAVTQPVSPLRQFWLRWRFHLNVLLILIPLGFMPRYFADMALFSGSSGLGEREIGEVQVGPGVSSSPNGVSNRRTTKAPPAS